MRSFLEPHVASFSGLQTSVIIVESCNTLMVNTTFHGTSHAQQYPVLSATLISVLYLLPHQLYAQSCLEFNLNNRRAKSFRRVTEAAARVKL